MTTSSKGHVRLTDRPHATHDRDGADLARGGLLNVLGMLAGSLRVIFLLLVARLQGPATLAAFSLAWTVIDLVSKIGTLGFGQATTAVVAATAPADGARRRELLRLSLAMAVPVSALLGAAGFLLAPSLAWWTGWSPSATRAIAVMSLALPGIALYRVGTAFSRGHRVMQHDLYSHGLAESLTTTLAYLLLLAAGAGAISPVLAALAGTAAGGVVACTLAWRLCPPAPGRRELSSRAALGLLRYSLPIAGHVLLNVASQRTDVLLLGSFVGTAPGVTMVTFGVYAAAAEIAGALRHARQVFDPILLPVLATDSKPERSAAARHTVGLLSRWLASVLLPAVALLVLSGEIVLRLFGPGYDLGASWLATLALAGGLHSLFGLTEAALTVRRPELNMLNSGVTLVAQAAVGLLLIPRWGVGGAAAAMLAGALLRTALWHVELRVFEGWSWPWHALRRPVTAFLPALIAGLVAHDMAGAWPSALALVAVYGWAWSRIGLDPEDRSVLDRLRTEVWIPRRWRR